MRWNTYKHGEIRIINTFLLFPKTINGETRWLEFALIKQQFHNYTCASVWDNICWLN